MILLGDCLIKMKTLDDNSIDSIVTDPPYGLSFMGKSWDYDVPSVEIWKEVLRVLKPGGHLLSFGGTRTYHRMVVNIEDAGFEIRDQIQWLYGSGFPKSHNIGNGIGTALKPANEPICLARKPLEGTVAQNFEKWGVGGLNIDATRVGTLDIIPSVSNQNIKGAGFKSDNSEKGRDTTYHQNPQGRWPANLLLDEVAAEMLDEQSGNLGLSKGSSRGGKRSQDFGLKAQDIPLGFGDSGGASRFFYCAKASKSERNRGLEGMPERPMNTYNFSEDGSFTKNSTAKSGDQVRESRQNHHPTVKPIRLMEYLIKLVCPPGGIVLDPFMGSGSTGVAAKNLGFGFVGIEMNKEYFEIAQRRMNGSNKQMELVI